ncbi:MAG: sn-glycerol-1-phosphate dehydrogenase [Bacteroidales bacterium]|nr:sn-glycerol-1-phosphate dehydrogenase [Bacteroidales bacterium]
MTREERINQALALSSDTKVFRMGCGVAEEAPKVFKECFPGKQALIIADVHTYPVLGEKVFKLMQDAGIPVDKYIIEEEEFHAEWKYVELVDSQLDAHPGAVLVSVGSGVINDLCKLSSHHHGQSYLTLPTAASVDGYSSFGASITFEGAKQTFSCPAPVAIVADIDIIAAAPKHMTAAGYADLAAKVPAGGEWMVADFVGTAPIHPEAWAVLQDYLDDFLSRPEEVAAGDTDAVADIFEGLTLSGIAMQIARSSRPASCCDHLFSHILDMTEHRYKGKLQSHGFQVAIGTLTMCAVFDEVFKLDLSALDVDAAVAAWPTLEQEQERALRIFEGFPAPRLGYDEITKKYQDADEVRRQLEKLKAEWPSLKARLQGQVYSYSKMRSLLKAAGAPYEPAQIGVSNKQLHDMFAKVQLMRFRFNLLDLAKRGGFYDAVVEPLFAKGGPFEI